MKILKLTQETSELQFSLDELLILKNSLLEVYQQFTINDFAALIRSISKDEALQLANLIGDIIYHYPVNSDLAAKNPLISSIQLIKEGVILELNYNILLGFNGILNVLGHEVGLQIQDFQGQIGFEKTQVLSFLSLIRHNVLDKMEENRPEQLIFNKSREIYHDLNLKREYLEANSLSAPIKEKCQLKLDSYLVIFLLKSLKNRKIFSGIQILARNLSDSVNSFTKSDAQAIRNEDLVRLIAYLELALTSAISDADLEKFALLLFNSKGDPSLEVQVLSRCIDSEKQGNLKIRFRLYLGIQENNRNNEYIIEENVSFRNIHDFIASIRAFLAELPQKELDQGYSVFSSS